jgi:predicted nuclease of predicted toxin-antitoxin system
MKLLIDMNLSPRWADALVEAGFEAVHWSSLGSADASDRAIMDFARENGFIVLTHDLDFGAILAVTHGDKPSVVQIRADDINPATIGVKVIAALRQVASELDAGALVTIDPNRTRIRLLPFLFKK